MFAKYFYACIRGIIASTRYRKEGNLGHLALTHKTPHIYHTRAYPFDLDFNAHLNQSSYLYAAEIARWNHLALSGLLTTSWENKWKFIAASQAIKYRREIEPLEKYKIHTVWEGVDDKNWLYVNQTFLTERDVKVDGKMIKKNVLNSHLQIKICVLDKDGKKLTLEKLWEHSLYKKEDFQLIQDINKSKSLTALQGWDDESFQFIRKYQL